MKVLHTGDWHIGNFAGPEINGENARFLDICKCLDSLTEQAANEQPDVIIIAGDIFHQAKVWSDRGLKENRTATHYIRLLEKVAPVVIVRGTPNHDSEQQYELLKNTFEGDADVKIITEPQVVKLFSGRNGWVQIAGLPGFDRGYYRAKHPGLSKEEENEVFTNELERLILGLKAQCEEGMPSVFVSHYTIPGCNMESGQTQFFAQFEPVIYPAALNAAGFDLNCFGHIHRPQHIEEAGNTFYCGAISALNFNDEAQERGFYVHDIVTTGTVNSTFHKLPTRQFVTLRFTDTDITGLNNGALDDVAYNWWRWNDGVKGAIVRVIYDCSDKQNKAFNKAVLEKALYDDGAFWVQEITPEKITISVNKDSLADDDGPEEQLCKFFTEKEYPVEKITEIIEAARPIISEASEDIKKGAKTGVFTPLSIEVKNYRNYREEAFDYDGIRFCTINGENGAGKSSLFMDAMLDALYEEPREGDLTGWICNDPAARSGSIQFTFAIGDAKYRVTRTRQKSGKATLNISEEVNGEWEDRSAEKFKDTQTIIEQVVGMDSLTFKACALIMQDQYGLFLQADKEARMAILGNILGLGVYDKMESLAADKLTDINRQIRVLNEKAADVTAKLPDEAELAAEMEETKRTIDELNADIEKENAEIDAAKVKLNTKLEAAQRVNRINNKLSALGTRTTTAISNKTTQKLIANGAEAALAEEPEIRNGVKLYEELCAKEKTLISTRDRRDELTEQVQKLTDEVMAIEADISRADASKRNLMRGLDEVTQALAGAELLRAKHEEYNATLDRLEKMQQEADEYADLMNRKNTAELQLSKLTSEVNAAAAKRDAVIAELKKRVALLENSGCPVSEKATCKFLADAVSARDLLPEKEKEAEAAAKEDAERIGEAARAAEDAAKAVEASSYSPAEMNELRVSLTALRGHERQYSELGALEERKATLEKDVAELNNRKAELDAKMQTTKAERDSLCDKLAVAREAATEYDKLMTEMGKAAVWVEKEKGLPVARERYAAATARLAELDEEIERINAEATELGKELAEEKLAAEGAEYLEGSVRRVEANVAEQREALNRASMKLGSLKAKEEGAKEDREAIKEMQKQVRELGELAAIYDDLKKAFSQDGIPHNVIRSLIPIFEATATGILGQMSGGKMSVEFITEKVLKSNSKKEVTTLDIVINDCNTGRLPYMSRSGGERVKAALSVILALSEIKSSKAGVQLGFLFIDEPPFLDDKGVTAYCDALEAIQSRYSDLKIMAITHDQTMKSRFPQSVDVVKTENGSKVIYQ